MVSFMDHHVETFAPYSPTRVLLTHVVLHGLICDYLCGEFHPNSPVWFPLWATMQTISPHADSHGLMIFTHGRMVYMVSRKPAV